MAVEGTGRLASGLGFINLGASMHSLEVAFYFNDSRRRSRGLRQNTMAQQFCMCWTDWARNQEANQDDFHICRIVNFPTGNAFSIIWVLRFARDRRGRQSPVSANHDDIC